MGGREALHLRARTGGRHRLASDLDVNRKQVNSTFSSVSSASVGGGRVQLFMPQGLPYYTYLYVIAYMCCVARCARVVTVCLMANCGVFSLPEVAYILS